MMLELEIKNENGEKEDIEKSQEGELADENSEEREAPEGTGYRTKTRFAKFFSLSELMNLFKQAADIQTADQLKLEKAVNYAFNHKETLMNYLLDGRCEISNNAAERRVKSYVMG